MMKLFVRIEFAKSVLWMLNNSPTRLVVSEQSNMECRTMCKRICQFKSKASVGLLIGNLSSFGDVCSILDTRPIFSIITKSVVDLSKIRTTRKGKKNYKN
ncbi:hypothetical protein ACKWTF_012817 [Chironomus riparius]